MLNKLLSLQQTFWKFFLKPASLSPFVFLRISFAIFAIALWITLYPSFQLLFGKEGYVEWFIADMFFSNKALPTLYKTLKLVNLVDTFSPVQFINALYFIYGGCIVMIGVGLFSNVFAFLAWLVHLVIFNTSVVYAYGVESFIHVLLFYFIFMPVDATSSLSSLFFKNYWIKRKAGSQIKARIFLRVLQIHLCIVYLDAGLSKMFGTHWWNGEAVWRSLTQFPFNPFNMTFLHNFPLLLQLSGWVVVAIETFYIFLVWNYKTRKFFLPCVLFMHAGIAVLVGLHFFGCIMIIMNIAAFAVNTEVEKVKPMHH